MGNAFQIQVAEEGKNFDYTKMPRDEAIIQLLLNFGMDTKFTRSEDAKKFIVDFVNDEYGKETPVNEVNMFSLNDYLTKDGFYITGSLVDADNIYFYSERNRIQTTASVKSLLPGESQSNHMKLITSNYILLNVDTNNRLVLTRVFETQHSRYDFNRDRSGELIKSEQINEELYSYSETSTISHGVEMDVSYTLEEKHPNKTIKSTLVLERDADVLSRASGPMTVSIEEKGKEQSQEYDLFNVKTNGLPIMDKTRKAKSYKLKAYPDLFRHDEDGFTHSDYEPSIFKETPLLDPSVINQIADLANRNMLSGLIDVFGYCGTDKNRLDKQEKKFLDEHNKLIQQSPYKKLYAELNPNQGLDPK